MSFHTQALAHSIFIREWQNWLLHVDFMQDLSHVTDVYWLLVGYLFITIKGYDALICGNLSNRYIYVILMSINRKSTLPNNKQLLLYNNYLILTLQLIRCQIATIMRHCSHTENKKQILSYNNFSTSRKVNNNFGQITNDMFVILQTSWSL